MYIYHLVILSPRVTVHTRPLSTVHHLPATCPRCPSAIAALLAASREDSWIYPIKGLTYKIYINFDYTDSNSPIFSIFFCLTMWETLLTTHFSFTFEKRENLAFALRHHDHLARPWIRLQHHCHGQLRPNDPKTQPQLVGRLRWNLV